MFAAGLGALAATLAAAPPGAHAATLAVGGASVSVSGASQPSILLLDTQKRTSRRVATGIDPAFSPDGRRLAYVASGGLRLLTLSTGREIMLDEGADSAPAFTAHGSAVYFNRPPAPSLPAEPSPGCSAGTSGPPPECAIIVDDRSTPDDIVLKRLPDGPTAVKGSGCLPAPAPDGHAVLSLTHRAFGIGCNGLGDLSISGTPSPAQPNCHGRKMVETPASALIRRASWLGRRGGIMITDERKLTLADSTGTPVCVLFEPRSIAIQDAVPSPDGHTVAVLESAGAADAIRVRILDVATAQSHVITWPIGFQARSIAWRPRAPVRHASNPSR